MRKLKLQVDALEVESFDTHTARGAPGTVRGREEAEAAITVPVTPQCTVNTCTNGCPTCGFTVCGNTCPMSACNTCASCTNCPTFNEPVCCT